MITVFERIPELFVQHYDMSFQTWGREFKTRGRRCAIPFDRPPGKPVILGSDGMPMNFAGAWLEAEVDRSNPQNIRIIIRPVDDENEQRIEQHTREMARHWNN
jgi:hypothetical protein